MRFLRLLPGLVLTVTVSMPAMALPFSLGVNLTTSGRWLEGTTVTAAHQRLSLEGSSFTLGGSLDAVHSFGALRVGALAGADIAMKPTEVDVTESGPLATSSSARSLRSLVFLQLAPLIGLGGQSDVFEGWVDLLVSLELASARFEGQQHLALTPVPTLRLGVAVRIGEGDFEASLLASYFGAPRLGLALGFRL